ncbi:MAG TPA: hypothetical protein VFS51_09265 [Gemmatimonadales bacterium]|nr:hypothetical protein [Gemmatimonadales bacterium]
MSTTAPGEGAGSSPFEPDASGLTPEPGAGQAVEHPDLRKTGEALRDRFEIRSLAMGSSLEGENAEIASE